VPFNGERWAVSGFQAKALLSGIPLVQQVNLRRLLSQMRDAISRKIAGDQAGHPLPVPVLVRRGEKGQALIEFALVFPLLFVFILVIVDFGLALDRREVIQHAVREGARSGAVGKTIQEITDHTNEQSGGILNNVKVCYVDDGNGPGNAGDSVRVSGDYSYNFAIGTGAFLSGVIPPINMTPSATARLEKAVAVPPADICP